MREKKKPPPKALQLARTVREPAEREAVVLALVREAEAVGLDVAVLLSEAIRTNGRVRHFLLLADEEKVTEKNLLGILREFPDALEAPSVRTLVSSVREELSRAWDEPLDPEEDLDDPDLAEAREKHRGDLKDRLLAIAAALAHAPRREGPKYHLEALERIQAAARESWKNGSFRRMQEAHEAAAQRYGFNSGSAFRQALYAARKNARAAIRT